MADHGKLVVGVAQLIHRSVTAGNQDSGAHEASVGRELSRSIGGVPRAPAGNYVIRPSAARIVDGAGLYCDRPQSVEGSAA
jgi:hypothetical protein